MSSFFSIEETRPISVQQSRLLEFIKYSNLHILLVAFGLLAGSSVLAGIDVSWPLLVAASSGAFLLYQLDRCILIRKEDETNQPLRVAWIRRHRTYVYGSCVVFLGIGSAAALFLTFSSALFGVILAGAGTLYLLPVLPGGGYPKRVWFIKPPAIVLAWSAGSVLLPVIEGGAPVTWIVIGLLSYRMFFILPNVLLSDWQDREGDREAGIISIAMMLTEVQLRVVCGVSLLFALLLGMCIGLTSEWPHIFFVDLAGPCIAALIVAKPLRRSHLLYGLIPDLVIAWPLITSLSLWLV